MKPLPDQLPLFGDIPRETLSKYLKYLRGPYSQQELAHIIGRQVPAVENWEQGLSVPRPAHMRALLEHYKSWAITRELGVAAVHAALAMGLKKDLTNPNEPDKQPAEPQELDH